MALHPCDLDADGVDERCPVGTEGLGALALKRFDKRVDIHAGGRHYSDRGLRPCVVGFEQRFEAAVVCEGEQLRQRPLARSEVT